MTVPLIAAALVVFWVGPVAWFLALLLREWRRRDPVDQHYRTALAVLWPDHPSLPRQRWWHRVLVWVQR